LKPVRETLLSVLLGKYGPVSPKGPEVGGITVGMPPSVDRVPPEAMHEHQSEVVRLDTDVHSLEGGHADTPCWLRSTTGYRTNETGCQPEHAHHTKLNR